MISEIFPNRIRGAAMSVAVTSLWIACFVLTYTFPILEQAPGPGGNILAVRRDLRGRMALHLLQAAGNQRKDAGRIGTGACRLIDWGEDRCKLASRDAVSWAPWVPRRPCWQPGPAVRRRPPAEPPAVGTGRMLSVKNFGTTGDGTTDDTAALQKALSAMTADSTLVIPPGQYRVTQPLRVRRLARFRITGSGHPTALIAGAPMPALLVVEYPAQDGLIDYLTLDAACKADVALRYEGGYAFFVDRVVIRRPRTIGIDVGGPGKYWGNEFIVTNCYLTGIRELNGEGAPADRHSRGKTVRLHVRHLAHSRLCRRRHSYRGRGPIVPATAHLQDAGGHLQDGHPHPQRGGLGSQLQIDNALEAYIDAAGDCITINSNCSCGRERPSAGTAWSSSAKGRGSLGNRQTAGHQCLDHGQHVLLHAEIAPPATSPRPRPFYSPDRRDDRHHARQ